jgi:hypothetical protein
MPGIKRCGVKVTPDGTPDEANGKPCALKMGHESPHKPRASVAIDADAVKGLAASVAVVTDTAQISAVRRTRTVADSPLSQLATSVVNGAHEAWVRGGKKTKWEETPTLAIDVPAGLEASVRSMIHRVSASLNRKTTFGDSKPLPGDPSKVKMFFQVRDLPVKTATAPAAESAAPAPAPAPAPSPAQQGAAAAAAQRAGGKK